MADSATDNFSFILPENGASATTWGVKLNTNWTDVDTLLNARFTGVDPITPDMTAEEWKISGELVMVTAAELNKLSGISGDPLTDDTSDTLGKGFANTTYDAGSMTTGTLQPDPLENNLQKVVNAGSFTLTPPAVDCSMILNVTNNANAGTITMLGWSDQSGDGFSSNDTDKFRCFISVINGEALINVKAY